MRSSMSHEWKIAIDDELRSLEKNGTWDLVDLPPNKRPIHSKWVSKIKRKSNGAIDRFKARLVAKGYSQRKGIDYDETFSLVVRLDSIRLIFSLVARFDLDMIHFDVSTAFLYGTLSGEVYMDPPEGVDADGKVCKLLKSIYDLKQASRVWNSCFVSFLKKFALEPLATDSCVLVKQGKQILIVAIYVDDGLVCCNDKDLLRETIEHLKQQFEISAIEAECYVGLQIKRDRARKLLMIHQTSYVEQIVARFDMEEATTASTPMDHAIKFVEKGVADGGTSKTVNVPYREVIGALMYVSVGTRPDVACAVSVLSNFCQSARQPHWIAAKTVLRYLNGSKAYVMMARHHSSRLRLATPITHRVETRENHSLAC